MTRLTAMFLFLLATACTDLPTKTEKPEVAAEFGGGLLNASTRTYGPESSYHPLRTTGSMSLAIDGVRVTARDTLTGSPTITATTAARSFWYLMKVTGGRGSRVGDRGDGTTFTVSNLDPGHYILKAGWRGRGGYAEFSVCPCVEVTANHASSVLDTATSRWAVTYDFEAELIGGGSLAAVVTTDPDNVVDRITIDGLTWSATVRHQYAQYWQEMVTVTPTGGNSVQLTYGPAPR